MYVACGSRRREQGAVNRVFSGPLPSFAAFTFHRHHGTPDITTTDLMIVGWARYRSYPRSIVESARTTAVNDTDMSDTYYRDIISGDTINTTS